MTASAATDLHLATAHHLLFLLLAGVLAFEIGAVRSSMDREDILRVARGRCLVWPLSRSHYSGRIFAGHLRGQRLGLLLRQPVLLGETWCLRRGGPVINHAHSRVHSLAKGDIGQSHLLTGCLRSPPPWLRATVRYRSSAEGCRSAPSTLTPQRKWTRTSAIRLFRFSPQPLLPIRAFPGSNSRKTYQWEPVGPRIR
jgi:hypothetical protein